MKLKVNIELLLFAVFIIHYSIAEPVSNEDVIAKVHDYIRSFNNLVKTQRRLINPELKAGYQVQQIDNPSIFVRGLLLISPSLDKIDVPGTVSEYSFLTQNAIAGTVYQNVSTIFGQPHYISEVPFVQANGQKVFYVVGEPSAGISADRGTIDTTLALSPLMGYIQGFYHLFKGHKRNVFTYWVLSNATQNYIRVLTTLPDANGNYAIGAILADATIVTTLKSWKTFTGPVTLFGKTYDSIYKPFKCLTHKL